MTRRGAGIAVVIASTGAYFGGFAIDHLVEYESASDSAQRLIELSWDVFLFLPFVGVAVAAQLWPRWWLVLAIAAFMFAWPIGVYHVEIATGLAEPLDDACDPCIDTRFLSFFALPALAIGLISTGIARWRTRSNLSRPHSRGLTP